MQQAYRALRVISEAQTVHIVLASRPGALMLAELSIASAALQTKGSGGIKAVILDFAGQVSAHSANQPGSPAELARARTAVRAIPQPVLAVARADLSPAACELLAEADFTLVAHEAELCLPESSAGSDNSIGGVAAARLGYATWSAPAASLDQELERVLDMLRTKSAMALRNAKASTRLAPAENTPATSLASAQMEALHRINQFYLETVMTTQDAQEGLRAFLEKRQPRWQNR